MRLDSLSECLDLSLWRTTRGEDYVALMETPGESGLLDRADRLLGCLLWKPIAALLTVFAVSSAWLSVRILRDTAGFERVVGFVLAIVVAGVLGLAAWRVLGRTRFSEGDFDV